jgi:hypothetical protein
LMTLFVSSKVTLCWAITILESAPLFVLIYNLSILAHYIHKRPLLLNAHSWLFITLVSREKRRTSVELLTCCNKGIKQVGEWCIQKWLT